MLTVACVLKSGPEYRVEHVHALAAGVRRHLMLPHRFVCLTDLDAAEFDPRPYCFPGFTGRFAREPYLGIEPIPLKHGWPGWWSKLELFSPGLFDGAVFYADLDTIIVGPLDDLVTGHRFTVLENFWSDQRIGSGLMAWHADEDLSRIYTRFTRVSAKAIREYVTTNAWGDQGWIKAHTPLQPARWQRLHPGRVFSYKRHIVPAGGVIPPTASIICYHGRPRPWQTPLWNAGTRAEMAL